MPSSHATNPVEGRVNSAVRESEIPHSIADLENAVESANELVGVLEDRLQTVLGPVDTGAGEKFEEEQHMRTDLGQRIIMNRNRLRSMRARITEILDRLEL